MEMFTSHFKDKCARHPGTRPSLWTVYLKVYGLKLVSAGCLKVAADFCELVGPLVIGGLTAYVSTLSYPVDIEPVSGRGTYLPGGNFTRKKLLSFKQLCLPEQGYHLKYHVINTVVSFLLMFAYYKTAKQILSFKAAL